ncbi:MAG: PqqD family protein [Acidimicrobiia bacterium]
MGPRAGTRRRARWERDERALWRAAPGLIVVLGPRGQAPIALHGSAVALWAALDRPRTVTELVGHLALAFDSDPEIIRADVQPVLDQLAEAGAVRRAP